MKIIIVSMITVMQCSCYSFKGISIPPEIKTFQVENFTQKALNAPADIEVQFSEALRAKILNESRLKQNVNNPDIEFSGSVVRYDVTSEAPREGNTVALNKLEIAVQVEYKNLQNEEDKWSKSFSFFQTYDSTSDLTAIEDQLIRVIFEQITERVFNDAFTTW
jgi:hypothetical protein